MSGHICNLVMPGAAKSGTSTLHDVLDQHPAIRMSRPKEPQFFSFDENFAAGPEAHNALFGTPEERAGATVFGESSQSYMVHEQALERIRASLTDPKIILVLREPVARLISQYRWNYKRAAETAPLMRAVCERGEDVGYRWDDDLKMRRENGGYVAFSRYTRWVPMWREAFGAENVLLLRTEDMAADLQRTASRCFAFLGLPDHAIGDQERRNTTEGMLRVGWPWYMRAAARLVPRRLKTEGYLALRRRIRVAITPTPPEVPTEAEAAALRALLADDIAFHAALGAD